MHGHGLLVGHYLLGRALHDKIAAYAVIAHALKAQLAESHAYASGTKLLRDATANDLQHPRRGHEHAVLMFQGLTEIEVYKLVLKARGLKLTVMTVLLLNLLFGEPEGEAALVKGEGLTVDAFVTERVLAGRDYALDLEGEPTAVAGGVGQERHVVAGATERRYVLAMLMEMGIGRSLVDGGHGDGCLELVELCRTHGVELLTAHQAILGQRQQVVARHAVGVGLGVEILLQLGWQEVVEPGGLIRSLLTYEHQDDVVHHILGDPTCYHADKPLLEGRTKSEE